MTVGPYIINAKNGIDDKPWTMRIFLNGWVYELRNWKSNFKRENQILKPLIPTVKTRLEALAPSEPIILLVGICEELWQAQVQSFFNSVHMRNNQRNSKENTREEEKKCSLNFSPKLTAKREKRITC